MNNLINELKLLKKSPKDYLWIYTYPTNKLVEIEEFNPEVKKEALKLINKINEQIPNLKVHYLGSSAMEVPGQKDIDIFIESLPKDFDQNILKLKSIIGNPIKRRRRFIEWGFKKNDIKFELLLIDPTWKKLKVKLDNFEILKQNRNVYIDFKRRSKGKTIREYEREKYILFFNVLKFK